MAVTDWLLNNADAVVSATRSIQTRTENEVTAYIEPRDYYQALATEIEKTQGGRAHFVMLSGWGFDANTPLDPANAGEGTVGGLIAKKSREGVMIFGMIWAHPDGSNRGAVSWFNGLPHGMGLHDDRVLFAGSHHQKFAVVRNAGGLIGFCGGMDIGSNRLKDGQYGRPWHDVQVGIKGPAAVDLWQTYYDRWTEQLPNTMGPPIAPTGGTTKNRGHTVQILRTYGDGSNHPGLNLAKNKEDIKTFGPTRRQARAYSFAPTGERTIYRLLIKAIRATRKSIYLEDQYLVGSAPIVSEPRLGDELRKAIWQKDFAGMIILTNGVGTVQGELYQVNRRRKELWEQIQLFGAAWAAPLQNVSVWAYKGGPTSPFWMHTKTWIFDDTLAVITSANCNRRGYCHDSEIAAAVLDPYVAEDLPFAHELRVRLWMKHLNSKKQRVKRDDILDFAAGAKLWVDTQDTDLTKLDLLAGDSNQPDRSILDPPAAPQGSWGALFREVERELLPLQPVSDEREFEWNTLIDPDGS